MCGILGVRWSFLARRHADPDAAVRRALAALQWRGPDGLGVVWTGDWALGCARLAITDRRSRQPVVRRKAELAAVFNGAVTSARREWERLRPTAARRARLCNDAWLPLLAVERDAPGLLQEFAGHRAAAVVDERTHRLVLARDPAGEKPLWVALQEGRPIAFASTLPALRELGIGSHFDDAALRRFFTFGHVGAPTADRADLELQGDLAGVFAAGQDGPLRALAAPHPSPAGTSASARPPGAVAAGRGAGAALPATSAAVRAALAAATERCALAEADQQVALSLSGGVDSSCLAALLAGRGLRAFQFLADGADPGERDLARAVAARHGLVFSPVDGGTEVCDALPLLTRCAGMPLGDPSVLAVHALARAAAAAGVRILLSGEGADEAFLGYARHRATALLGAPGARALLRALPGPSPWSMRRSARLRRAAAATDPYAELLAVTPPGFRAATLAAPLAPGGTLPALGAPIGTMAPIGAMAATAPANGTDTTASPLARARAVDFAHYLRWDLLPKLDVATMAAGIEGRCPFLDAEVLAAALAFAPSALLGKRPLRAAFAAELPRAVLRQKKRGFALPLDRWFRGELPWLDLLRESRTRQRPHLQRGGIDRAIDHHRRGGADLGHALYLLVALEVHLRCGEETA